MIESSYYETDRAVSEYLLFHYGSDEEVLPWGEGPKAALSYPARCVSECLDLTRLRAGGRALDLGCAVGRSTFELARHCSEVIGIDYSDRFIRTARRLQMEGGADYTCVEEGELVASRVARVPPGVDRSRVTFEQGDAQALRPGLGVFDVVLMANLVDRLREPGRCLNALPGLVRVGGQLIVTTPCTWLEEYTPRAAWLGGFVKDGKAVRTLDSLRSALEGSFELVRVSDMPFLIREHARKYQWSVAQASLWVRRGG